MKHDYMYLTLKIACDFSVLHCDSLPVCATVSQGDPGPPGVFGRKGEKGSEGHPGLTGVPGPHGIRGEAGAAGIPGMGYFWRAGDMLVEGDDSSNGTRCLGVAHRLTLPAANLNSSFVVRAAGPARVTWRILQLAKAETTAKLLN